jgi:hypothetical protein
MMPMTDKLSIFSFLFFSFIEYKFMGRLLHVWVMWLAIIISCTPLGKSKDKVFKTFHHMKNVMMFIDFDVKFFII